MGSKQVREAHMLRYGATNAQLHGDLEEQPLSKVRLEACCDRLSKPRRCVKKFVYESRSKLDHSSSQMDELFPPHTDIDEILDVAEESRYPEDWRRLPVEKLGGHMTWIYECFHLDIETPLSKSQAQVRHQISKALRDTNVAPVDQSTTRKDVRSMISEGDRVGILVDIVATRRNIFSGVPHDLAAYIYKLLEDQYPITVRFAFIGITDNATKLVAKDIFDSRTHGTTRKLGFGDIDGEHLHIAYPRENEAQSMRERGVAELHRKEEERKRRTWTPKFQPQHEPAWMAAARQATERAKEFLKVDHSTSFVVPCSRCWSHQLDENHLSTSQACQHTAANHQKQSPAEKSVQLQHIESTSTKDHTLSSYEQSMYTAENCVDRLREVRRRYYREKSLSTRVKPAVELKRVAERIAEKSRISM